MSVGVEIPKGQTIIKGDVFSYNADVGPCSYSVGRKVGSGEGIDPRARIFRPTQPHTSEDLMKILKEKGPSAPELQGEFVLVRE